MVTDLLYRAKRIDNGEWVIGRYYEAPLISRNSLDNGVMRYQRIDAGEIMHLIATTSGFIYKVDKETKCMQVGLQDKNKNDFFENDIVRFLTWRTKNKGGI